MIFRHENLSDLLLERLGVLPVGVSLDREFCWPKLESQNLAETFSLSFFISPFLLVYAMQPHRLYFLEVIYKIYDS